MKKTIWAIICCIIIALVLIIAKDSKPEPVSKKPIKIGALLSLTGGASAWGENAKKGIALATDEINKNGGIDGKQIEIIYEDTASTPRTSVAAFKKITDLDDIDAIIGPLNQTEIQSVMPLILQKNIPTISPGFLPLQERKNINNPIFVWTDAEIEAGQLASYVYGRGITRVAVIGTIDAWESTVTNAFVNKFKSLGGTVTDLEIVQPTTSDMKLSVAKVLDTKPQAIYLGTYFQFVNSLKEISNHGYKGELFGIEVDNYLATETSGWSNGLKFIAPDYYKDDFIESFKSKYKDEPGMPAGQAYDTVNILSVLLRGSKNQKDTLVNMSNFKEFVGASGKLTISPDGRTSLPTAIFQINRGNVVRVEALSL